MMNVKLISLSRIAFVLAPLLVGPTSAMAEDKPSRAIDFNKDIRPILSNQCFTCHGPDETKRKGVNKPLRLDTAAGAFADLGGYAAIIKGKPADSEMIDRITSDDPNEVMPPPKHSKKLSNRDVDLITTWIKQGAPFTKHWSYTNLIRNAPPEVSEKSWSNHPIDRFVLGRLQSEGLKPSPESDPLSLLRRVSLDITGLPPTQQDIDTFVKDKSPLAYERAVDCLLAKPAYGEHWGRLWLDLARYADSAGYADDPARTIWAYRDYVIRSFNANKPFNMFTIEQLAGDLLPNPTDEQLTATAFHRNTLTNNEGGTNDEEFRNVAVVDRVNTTMAVWMGTTIACAQCHSHKYDPLSQTDYFRLFAIFNNTQDADRTDESPVLSIFSDAQKRQKTDWEAEIAKLEASIQKPAQSVLMGEAAWESAFASGPKWSPRKPGSALAKSGVKLNVLDDQSVVVEPQSKTDTYTIRFPIDSKTLSAVRLETFPNDAKSGKPATKTFGNFVVSKISATLTPPNNRPISGRYVRIELPGKSKILSLAEVEVISGSTNVARTGEAKQSSTDFEGPAALAIDGKTDGRYNEAKSTTHTAISDNPWWEVDLKSVQSLDRIVVWNRTDNGAGTRLSDFQMIVLDEKRKQVWTQAVAKPPKPSTSFALSSEREIPFARAIADYAQPGFEAASVLETKPIAEKGWAVGDQSALPHTLTLIPKSALTIEPGSMITLMIEHRSKHDSHTLGRFRASTSDDPRAIEFAGIPDSVVSVLKTSPSKRSQAQEDELTRYYIASIAPELKPIRERIASLKTQAASMKPETTVPILREVTGQSRRKTKLQRRGNFMDLGEEVSEGIPSTLGSLPSGQPLNRLTFAQWLMSPENPLTSRVVANRYWEQLFGTGIVSTSEDFGAQGDQPVNAELLDFLASELVQNRWDMKAFLKFVVTSKTYRQTSKVTDELFQRDPENRLNARGPRVRLSAEMVRDQALAAAGLLSSKMFGPPVKPPQPSLGLSAAFGSAVDWETSKGEDRYRRGLYTTWRRSSPYPSMATFDAPNRETCTLRRNRTNTPLQALVTMNDPVYVEAAQALARRIIAHGSTVPEKARFGLKQCLVRDPSEEEVARIVKLFESSKAIFAKDEPHAKQLATEPIGPAPNGVDVADLAAWTVAGNVLLNLDEMLMKR
jgi:hypothetical protein